jgi:hypothetical protein
MNVRLHVAFYPTNQLIDTRAWPECQVMVVWACPRACQHQASRSFVSPERHGAEIQACMHLNFIMCILLSCTKAFEDQQTVFCNLQHSKTQVGMYIGRGKTPQHVAMSRELGEGMLTNPFLPPMSQVVN